MGARPSHLELGGALHRCCDPGVLARRAPLATPKTALLRHCCVNKAPGARRAPRSTECAPSCVCAGFWRRPSIAKVKGKSMFFREVGSRFGAWTPSTRPCRLTEDHADKRYSFCIANRCNEPRHHSQSHRPEDRADGACTRRQPVHKANSSWRRALRFAQESGTQSQKKRLHWAVVSVSCVE